MVVVEAYVAITLLVHHRRRVSRHESIPSYYRHLAVGH